MDPHEKLRLLNEVLEGCKASLFYRDRIPGRPLRSFKELKRIPLTTKQDLRRCSPFELLCVPRAAICQYHETYGTTGPPVSTWFTKHDLKDNAKEITRCGISFNKEDTVLVRFPYAISAVAHMVHAAAQSKGACVIPASSRSTVSPFPRVVNLLKNLEVTILAGLPLQALLIAETAELQGLNPHEDFPHLRAILTAGEPLSGARRKLLQNIWGVPVFDIYGMAEIGTAVVDCEFGRPHSLEDYFVFEILDKDLKKDVKTGEMGYLVVTTLKKRATPMIRYLTGDLARIEEEDCACGRKICLEVRGRRDDAINVKGRLLDRWDFEDILSNLPCWRFWAAGPAPGGVHIVVEAEKAGDSVPRELIEMLEDKYGMRFRIEVVPKGTLYDRSELLAVAAVGKPQHIYSAPEMEQKAYIKGVKV
ncbi:MAG: AMP-binding protein [Bacillota bacterium]